MYRLLGNKTWINKIPVSFYYDDVKPSVNQMKYKIVIHAATYIYNIQGGVYYKNKDSQYKQIKTNTPTTWTQDIETEFIISDASNLANFSLYSTVSGGVKNQTIYSFTIPTIPLTSNLSVPTEVNIGDTINIAISRNVASNKDTLQYSFNGGALTTIATDIQDQYLFWRVPLQFYTIIPNARSADGYFRLSTYDINDNLLGYKDYPFTAYADEQACKPVIDATLEDTRQLTVALTGDAAHKFVKGVSLMNIDYGARPLNGATISYKSVTAGSVETTTRFLDKPDDNKFVIKVIDSRGYSNSQTIEMEMIPYIQLTCNLAANPPTTEGKARLSVDGNYYNGSFGARDNTLTISYRYKIDDPEAQYTEWTQIDNTPSFYDGRYSVSFEVSGLDYLKPYKFEVRAEDEITIQDSYEVGASAVSLFDFDNQNFNFNIPIYYKNNPIDYITEEDEYNGWHYYKYISGKVEAFYNLGQLGTRHLTRRAESVYSHDDVFNVSVSLPFGLFTEITNATASAISADGYLTAQVALSSDTEIRYRVWQPFASDVNIQDVQIHIIGKKTV